MPKAGFRWRSVPPEFSNVQIVNGHAIGRRDGGRYAWRECATCREGKWVQIRRWDRQCFTCKRNEQRGPAHHSWRGGKRKNNDGYIRAWIATDDPLRVMARKSDGYVLEHRVVVARWLSRPLFDWEEVHHRNGNRSDNRIENLELWMRSQPTGVRQSDYHCPGCRCFDESKQ